MNLPTTDPQTFAKRGPRFIAVLFVAAVFGSLFQKGVTGVPGLVVEGLVVTRNASLGKTRV